MIILAGIRNQLHEDLKTDRYRPLPVRQKLIPKEGQPAPTIERPRGVNR